MAAKSRFTARLTGDHHRLAELAEADGDLSKAADHWGRAKQFTRALELAAKVGSSQRAIRFGFQAALGDDAKIPEGATARQAGDLLRASGKLNEALILYELGSSYGPAADVAAKLKKPLRAAELFEKAGDWAKASIYYENENRLADAVRMLGLRSRQLQKAIDERRQPGAEEEKREVDDRRAAILARLGRGSEATRVIEGQAPTPQSASLLEQNGRWQEAFEAYLDMNDHDSAAAMAERISGLSARQRADLLVRCGRQEKAARLLIDAGLTEDGLQLLEDGQRWAEAALVREQIRDYLGAGACHRRAGDHEAAARCFRKAGEPALAAEAYTRLGRHSDAVTYHLQAGQVREAAAAFERNHQYTEAADYFIKVGDRQRAIAALENMPHGADDWPAANLRLVTMLLDEGEAAKALERVREISDNPHEVGEAALERIYWEGRCLEELGRGADAADFYRRLQELAPDHRDVARRLAEPAPPPPVATLEQGGMLAGRYRIDGEIGRGGMGRVYRAVDEELDEAIALKVLLRSDDDANGESRLIREVQICRRITHPNIVRIFDIGRFDRGLFVTMELLEGRDLGAIIEDDGPLDLARCRDILTDVLAGLKEAHAQSVVHRDLKPQNLFQTAERTKILDFGIAHGKAFDRRLTQTGHAMGTPAFMAPEQLQGKAIDGRTDLYALGLVAYEMLTGRGPFEADNPTALALAQIHEPPRNVRELREGLPEAWGQFVHRLLAKEPDLRLPSVGHVLNVVHALPDG